ncbi:MAG: hypothetical protein LBS50_03250 [Prevotellaceae bacterium]|jgi:hypothetical protein|nr:hypothetical protein [Prevotellaceae bacterium]
MTKTSFNLKNVATIVACFAVSLTFSSCGGGSGKYVDNKMLGKFPSIFMEYYRLESELSENGRNGKISQKKWASETERLEKQRTDDASAEFKRIEGREVPFRFDYEDADYKIVSAKIEQAHETTGALGISLVIEAKRDFSPSTNFQLRYTILNDEDKGIFGGNINPFIKIQGIYSNRAPQHVVAGEILCQEGSNLMLYCGSYDFTKFKEIVFTQR